MLTSAPLPMLNTSPSACGSFINEVNAETTSPTQVKLRVCVPSP